MYLGVPELQAQARHLHRLRDVGRCGQAGRQRLPDSDGVGAACGLRGQVVGERQRARRTGDGVPHDSTSSSFSAVRFCFIRVKAVGRSTPGSPGAVRVDDACLSGLAFTVCGAYLMTSSVVSAWLPASSGCGIRTSSPVAYTTVGWAPVFSGAGGKSEGTPHSASGIAAYVGVTTQSPVSVARSVSAKPSRA